MTILLEQFVQNIADSGLMSPDKIRAFIESLPADERPADGAALARIMTEKGELTPYQAEVLCRGETNGLVFDQYVVLEKIGQGGMGVVVKARHRRMDRMVAVKKLAGEGLKSDDAVGRFEREVKALAKLKHTNIVTAFDFREQDGVAYLILEYVEGRDLSEIVIEDGPLPVERAVEYIIQAANGLAYAHKRGVTHRDIKPGNLLVDEEGTVKVLDMGLAAIEEVAVTGGDAPTMEHLTSDGQVMGTCDYMAPEQAKDSKAADHRSDIYSLGCTFYRLLTGDVPYKVGSGSSNYTVIFAHLEQKIPSLIERRPEVSPEIDAVYRRMLAKDPSERYQTMKEVIADLEATRGGDAPSDDSIHADPPDEELSSFFDHVRDDPSSVSAIGKRAGMSGIGSRGDRSGVGRRGSSSRKRDKKSGDKVTGAVVEKSKSANDTVSQVATEDTDQDAAESDGAGAADVEPKSHRPVPRRRRNRNQMVIVIGAVSVACVVGAVIVAVQLFGQAPVGTVSVKTEDESVRVLLTRDGETVAQVDGQAAWQAELTEGEYLVSLDGGSGDLTLDKTTITVAGGSEVQLTVTRKPKTAGPDPGLALRPGEWVDLVHHIVAQEDVKQGEWSFADSCVSCRWDNTATSYGAGYLRLPIRLKGSYDLRIVGDNLVGDSIYLPGPSGHGLCRFFNDGTSLIARQSGFERALPVEGGAGVGNGEQRQFHVSVVTDGRAISITAQGDGQTYFKWRGLATELNLLAGDPEAAGAIVLATDNSPVRYRLIQVRVHGDQGHVLRPAAAVAEAEEDRALQFDGPWAWLRTPLVYDGSHHITIEAWVDSQSGVSETQSIVSDSGGHGVLSLEMLKDGFFRFALRDRQDQWKAVVPEWTSLYDHFHHVAAVYDGSQMRLYVDGRERGSAECAGVHDNTTKAPLMIGATPQSESNFQTGRRCFVGLIDEVRISSTARYTKDFQPPERLEPDQDTLALYHLDEVAGGIARDASDHKLQGKVIGAKFVPLASAVSRSRNLVYPPTASQTLPNGWRISEPVNLGPHINQATHESTPFLTADGLTLIYCSDGRPGGTGAHDLWMCNRESLTEPFGDPVNLGAAVNSDVLDAAPALSADRLTLVFVSRRPGSANNDIYTCSRKTASAEFDEPVKLAAVNSGNSDAGPSFSADGLTLMFHSDRPGGEGYGDLWQSTRESLDDDFSTPVNLGPIVNTRFGEGTPKLSADGLMLLFDSSRRGGRGKADLWMCTRKTVEEKFGPPVNLSSNTNTAWSEWSPAFSEQAQILVFASDREGGYGGGDLYLSKITRTGPDEAGDGAEAAQGTDATQDATPDETAQPPDAAGTDSTQAADDEAEMTADQELISDRDVAKWVIAQMGGKVILKTGPDAGGEAIADEQDLPSEPYQLFSIDLAETSVSDQDLERLPTLSELRELHLNNTQVTGVGFAAMEPLPKLGLLQLTGSEVSDGGLAHLDKFPAIATLTLRNTAVTDAGIERLAQNATVERIDLQETKITDAALETLATLPRLKVASLRGTSVSDEGLKHLFGRQDLLVAVKDTQVTTEGREELTQALTGRSQVID